jgi:hypothetical protein
MGGGCGVRGVHTMLSDMACAILLHGAMPLLCALLFADSTPPASLRARQNCSIMGRVLDDRGRPVEYAVVNALREELLGSAQGTFGAVTNAGGEYCISVLPEGAPLPAGRYRLRAAAGKAPLSASPSCQSCCDRAQDLVTTYYPNVSNQLRAATVFFSPGQPVKGIDIRLQRGAVYCARGEVRSRSGALAEGVALSLTMNQTGRSAAVITESSRFLLTNLEPGVYTLILSGRAQLGTTLAQRTFTIRDRNIEDLVITAP